MTSRGNQSVSPPAQIPQQRHGNTVSSGTPPPQQYYTGHSSALPQVAYDFLPQGQTFLPYQSVPTYGNSINDIRGPPGNNGRAGPIQQGIPQGFYQQLSSHMRPQQMPQGPTANQQGFISTQGPGTYCQPRPQSQPSQQFLYYSNFQPGNNVYAMPAMYGGHPTLSVYQQNPYISTYQPNIQSYQNGMQWRGQGMAPTGAPYTGRLQPPREKKVLEIQDPNTGRIMNAEIFSNRTHSADTDEFYEQVPPVNKKKEICQAFTRQVADRLKSPDEPGSLEVSPESQGAVGGSPAGPSVTSQQYQQPPPQQQVHQLTHPQQQVHQLTHPQQQLQQQQQQPSTGPSPMMRAPMNGPPPAMQHQVMPPRSGMIQQPPASVTPPHEIQHQLLNVNLSVPPPHLPMRQPSQPVYSSAPQQQQQQHHVPHHPQTPPQQQSIRPQMLPSMPAGLQQIQSQSPHYTPPNQSPPYNQIPPTNIAHHPISQPFKTDLVVPEKQILLPEASSQSNIPSLMSGPAPKPTQPTRTTSPVKDASSEMHHRTEQIVDNKSNPTQSSLKTSTSFGEDEQINDKPEDSGKEETFQGANFQGVKDVRKGKKNLKDLNRKDIGGSDMDAFIDKMDATIGGAVDESDVSITNSALESLMEPAINGPCVLENVPVHASFEEFETVQGASVSKDPQITNSRTAAQKSVLEAELSGASLENGHLKDNLSTQKAHEHQKQVTSSTQVEIKAKQKKKKKKGHQSPPIPKWKQGTAPSENAEKQNEAMGADKISSDVVNTESRDKSAVLQEKSSLRQDKSAVLQDKSAVLQDKSASLQDKPSVQQNKSSVQQDKSSVQHDKSSVQQDKSYVQQDKSYVQQDKSAGKTDTSSVQHKSSVQQDKSSVQQDKYAVQQDKSAFQQDKSTFQQDKSAVQQDKSAVQQDKSAVQQDKSTVQQDKSAVQQDKSAVQQDKSAVIQNKPTANQDMASVIQDKFAVRQDRPAFRQDKPATSQDISVQQEKPTASQVKSTSQDRSITPSSPTPTQTQASKTTPLPQSPAPVSSSLPQQRQAEDKSNKAFLKEDKPISTAPSTTNSVILDINLNPSGNQNQQTRRSFQANHILLEQSKHSEDSGVPQDVSAESAKTGDSSEVNHQLFNDETEPLSNSNQGSIDQKEMAYEIEDDAAFSKPSPDKNFSKLRKVGKDKLQYDRAYLMELRDCPSSQTKPEGLPDLDIILDLPLVNTSRVASLDFTPSFFQPTGNTRNTPQPGKTNSRSRQRTDVQIPQRVLSVSLQDSVKLLHQSEKPWKPTPKQTEKRKSLESEILFIMNRLTPTNFERLAEEMKTLDIKTIDDLNELVKIFFDKVTIETKFVEAYAKLCKVISAVKVLTPPNSGTKENQTTFRVAMLTKCQQEFEADKTTIFEDPEERRKKMEAELPDSPERAVLIDQTLYQMKMRRLKFYGNIRFIGELFKLKMLTENIMHDCIYRLLKAKDDDSLVSLCNLIATVGQALDTEKAKMKMDQYFVQMAKIADERKSRIKFTLKDIIELRNNNWVPRKEQAAPKKIDEVHKDFHQEQATKQFLQSQPLPPRMEAAQSNTKRGSRQRQDDKQQTDDGWNTVGSKSLRIDVSKMRLSKNVVDENSIQLGPCGGVKQLWGKGSSGATQLTQEHERSPAGNRFSALKFEEDRRSQRSPTRGDGGGGSARGTRPGPMVGHGQGKILARSSQEGDRRDALASARYIAGGMSQDSSRENSRNREDSRQSAPSREGDSSLARSNGSQRANYDLHQSRATAPPAPPGAAAASYDNGQAMKKMKPLSEDEMQQKAKTILEEYLSVFDLEEAKLCLKELEGQIHLSLFVMTCINNVLEKSYKERDLTGSFFHEMIKHDLLPLDVYFRGLADVLEFAEDMVIDIPKMWTYLAQIIVPVLDGVTVSWSDLAEALKPSLNKRCCTTLIVEILHVAKEKTSPSEAAEMWQSSHMDWSTFLDPDELGQFLRDKKLEFTVQPVAARSQSRSGDASQVGLQKLTEDIEGIVRRGGSNVEICARIDKHAEAGKVDKPVIRAIVTAIVNSSVLSTTCSTKKLREEVFKAHTEAIQRYIHNSVDLELQALYAIQALMHKLEHPSGVIANIFSILYDEEVISEDAIKQWEMSSDPREAEGKGPCFMQLTQFFTWLRENEEPEAS